MRQVIRRPVSLTGLVLTVVFVAVALAGPYLSPSDPTRMDLAARLAQPSPVNLLGTDEFGRDVLSRILWGMRTTLFIGAAAVVFAATVGAFLGLVSGYFGGILDTLLMRLMDALLALPAILLAIFLGAVLVPGMRTAVIAIGIALLPRFARVVRGSALSIRRLDYIEACRAVGVGNVRMLFHHVLPNALTPLMVMFTLYLGQAILLEAALSFLGLGVQPPAPALGGMIASGRSFLMTAPWISTFAGLAIMIFVISVNLLGDGVRDALDPRLRGEV